MEPGDPTYKGEYHPVTLLLTGNASTWVGAWSSLAYFETDPRPTALLLAAKSAYAGTDEGRILKDMPLPDALREGKVTEVQWKDQTLGIVVYRYMDNLSSKYDLSYAAIYSYAVAHKQLNAINIREEAKTVDFINPVNLKTILEARKPERGKSI